ncbi:hypothetical protein [Embleya hyalina]|uniref:Gram-positive cocci surface proteins LPxTG domain-containing protein n=1 Tax=Embleya hyalina TaxID=516124 RepID=A0A401YN94_9ACTN|nr:hypothetical protein [Embleya hyalina]GCD95979.1 hypothetical protein EHYA_03663 [Embleya hyalina]
MRDTNGTSDTNSTATSGRRTGFRLPRLSIVLAASASVLLSVAGPAHAAPAKDPLPADIPDYQAALDVVRSTTVRDSVCRFLSTPMPAEAAGTVQTIPDTPEPCQGLPAFTIKDPVALNEIAPGFVAGTAPPLPTEAVKLTYLLSSLSTTVNGRTATVMLTPTQGGGWHLAAIRDGDTDAAYADKATVGTLVFTEPQLRAWYQLKLTTVEPLNDQARQGLDSRASMSLGDYQKLVKARYADKQPGSEYDTKGYSSGYSPRRTTDEASSSTPLLAGSGAALALTGGAIVLHRRRRANTG